MLRPRAPDVRTAVEALVDIAGDDAPLAARRAHAAIGHALAPVYRSAWFECADRCSRLTPSGFPFQIGWSPGEDGMRWAADAAGPECPESARLAQAFDTLDALGTSMAPHLADALARLQHGQPLRFGAWLGGRHAATGDTASLYAEWPLRAHRWVRAAAQVHAPFARLESCRRLAAPRALEFDGDGEAAIWLRPRASGHDGLWPIAHALDAVDEFACLIGAAAHLMRARRRDARVRWLVRVAIDDAGAVTSVALAGTAASVAASQHALRCAVQAFDDHSRLAREWLAWGALDAATVALGMTRDDPDVRLLVGLTPARRAPAG